MRERTPERAYCAALLLLSSAGAVVGPNTVRGTSEATCTEVTLGGASLVSSTFHPRRRIAFY